MTQLGGCYRDMVTGFVGVATGRAEFLYGNTDVRLTAQTGECGDLKERWISEDQIEEVVKPSSTGFSPGEDTDGT